MEPKPLKINLSIRYDGHVKKSLRQLDFDDNSEIPKHLLGFSINYNLTKRRIERYFDDRERHLNDPNFEWRRWRNMEELDKECFEFNIQQE